MSPLGTAGRLDSMTTGYVPGTSTGAIEDGVLHVAAHPLDHSRADFRRDTQHSPGAVR